jgi:hypothetical protein
MKIKSITDVITNSSTEVFICTSSKSESELRDMFKKEDNCFLNWFSNITKFDLSLYRTWSQKVRKREEEDYNFNANYLDEETDPELTMGYPYKIFATVYENFPDEVLKNDIFYNLYLDFLQDPKKEEPEIVEIHGMKWKVYQEIKEPIGLLDDFNEKLKQEIIKIKAKDESDKEWYERSLERNTEDKMDTYRLRYFDSTLLYIDWVRKFIGDNLNKFPKYKNLIEMYNSLPDVSSLDNNFIDTFEDDCLPRDYDKGFEKLETIVDNYNCRRLS